MAGRRVFVAALLLGLGPAALTACTAPRRFGAETRLWPGPARFRDAAVAAVTDPHTWVPLALAGAVALADADASISRWAVRHQPVFGSRENAIRVGESIEEAAAWGALGTALAAPSGTGPAEIAWNKSRALAVEYLVIPTRSTVNAWIKDRTQRERPDGSNRQSFPSSRASTTAAYAALGRRNLDALAVPAGARRVGQTAFAASAVLASWSRVEAQKHYPTDVLAGYALGNLLAVFMAEAFIGPVHNPPLAPYVALGRSPSDAPQLEVGVSIVR